MVKATKDGSVDAVPQILYGQYLSHEQGAHSDKIELIVWPEIPQMPHKISAQFVCGSPKVSNF